MLPTNIDPNNRRNGRTSEWIKRRGRKRFHIVDGIKKTRIYSETKILDQGRIKWREAMTSPA